MWFRTTRAQKKTRKDEAEAAAIKAREAKKIQHSLQSEHRSELRAAKIAKLEERGAEAEATKRGKCEKWDADVATSTTRKIEVQQKRMEDYEGGKATRRGRQLGGLSTRVSNSERRYAHAGVRASNRQEQKHAKLAKSAFVDSSSKSSKIEAMARRAAELEAKKHDRYVETGGFEGWIERKHTKEADQSGSRCIIG